MRESSQLNESELPGEGGRREHEGEASKTASYNERDTSYYIPWDQMAMAIIKGRHRDTASPIGRYHQSVHVYRSGSQPTVG
jgi:hypothetical protein